MTSIGETLRRERVRRNLGLDQISRELKISPKLLYAIEAEEFDKLPGTIFAKNFVRQYARLLGLDEEEMAAEVQRALQPPPEVPNFAQKGKAPPVETFQPQPPPIQLPRVDDWESAGDRGFSWSSPLPALALFVVAMLVCSGVYAWYQRTRHPVLAQNQTTSSAPVEQPAAPPAVEPPAAPPQSQEATPGGVETARQQTPAPAPSQPSPVQAVPPQTPPPPKPAETTTPAARTPETVAAKPVPPAVPAAAPPSDSAAPSGPIRVRLEITAEEPSWVLVRTDGKYLFSGTLEANQTRTAEASRNLELRLGNAGGVNVTLNGKAIGALGPKGQVRTVQFTSGGFQIVAAPKSAPLDAPR